MSADTPKPARSATSPGTPATGRSATSAEAQLERLLYILPAAARPGGIAIEELARALDVPPKTVMKDLEHATMRAYYHPAGSVDAFTILIDGDHVEVHAPDQFRRPVRLSPREALALGLGLRALAAEVDDGRRSDVVDLAVRLERELAAPDDLARHGGSATETAAGDVEYEPDMLLGFDDDALRGVIADAVERRCACTLWYLKPGDRAPGERRVVPHRLVFAEGAWYVAAHDVERDGLRFFRMDRVLGVDLLDEAGDTLPDVDLAAVVADGAAFVAADEQPVTVRYDAEIARWIAERVPTEPGEDGAVVVDHPVADPRWLVRHVLGYGGAARVEQPPEARRWVHEAARRLAEA